MALQPFFFCFVLFLVCEVWICPAQRGATCNEDTVPGEGSITGPIDAGL